MNFRQAVFTDLWNNVRGKKYRQKVGRPYMRFREMIIFEELVTNLQPKSVLEWGAGYSSTYFPKFLKRDFKWLSIENNGDWISHLKELDLDKRVNIELVKENSEGRYGYFNDGTYEEFKDYIEFPSDKGPFDYIVIDGRARSACLKKAYDIISDDGVVVMHDANRKIYHEHFPLFEHQFLIQDTRPTSGGMAVLSKTRDIKELIDVERHEKNWKYVRNGLANLLMI